MRYLGIDFGSKKVGLALSDESGAMGFPHSVVPNTPDLLTTVLRLIEKEKVGAVVLGESRDLAGNDNPIAAHAHAFGDEIARDAAVPVFYESEVFTSAEARRMFEPAEKTRKPQNTDPIDASAAALILTSYLSKQHV
jgi:putative Holliday junction resolvase